MNIAIPPKAAWVLGGVSAVLLVGLIVFFVRGSDPASRPPIPHKKVDYQAYMQRQQQSERQRPADGRP